MKTRLQAVALASVLATAPVLTPTPVAAGDYGACLDGCASEFGGSDPATVSLRGWCYILRCTGA